MRLDHLLSKEQLIGKPIQWPRSAECADRVLEGGDTGQSEPATVFQVSTAVGASGCRRCGNLWEMRLGMAYKHAPCWVSEGTTVVRETPRLVFNARHDLAFHIGHLRVGFGGERLRVVGWSLVENCTVDASILFSVVKLSRANGGCLGTRSR